MSLLLVAFACSSELATSADKQAEFPPAVDESAQYKQEVLLKKLDNPCGLVSRPSADKDAPQEIFFSESGAGRVLVFGADRPRATQEVLTGLKTHELAQDVELRVGPWSLGFVTPTKLAVWDGVPRDGVKQVGVYVLPTDDKVLTADDVEHVAELPKDDSQIGNSAFPGMVMGETSAYLSSGSAEDIGTIFKAALVANQISSPRTLTPSKQSSDMHWPTGLCLSPPTKTQFLVAAYVGDLLDKRDSRVAFLVPANGEVALELVPGLFDVVGLAYSPSGQLYAIDFAWHKEKLGGIYRLDDARLDGRPACRAVKIANLVRPTSLLFDASGAMYVTAFGTGTNAKRGSLIKITGEF
ncbi:MAG: hypothetical protein SH868_07645 [Bythopirellula sp.]|nr:hypothetical protein [Bythopirellula sp.]